MTPSEHIAIGITIGTVSAVAQVEALAEACSGTPTEWALRQLAHDIRAASEKVGRDVIEHPERWVGALAGRREG